MIGRLTNAPVGDALDDALAASAVDYAERLERLESLEDPERLDNDELELIEGEFPDVRPRAGSNSLIKSCTPLLEDAKPVVVTFLVWILCAALRYFIAPNTDLTAFNAFMWWSGNVEWYYKPKRAFWYSHYRFMSSIWLWIALIGSFLVVGVRLYWERSNGNGNSFYLALSPFQRKKNVLTQRYCNTRKKYFSFFPLSNTQTQTLPVFNSTQSILDVPRTSR